ncbi:MAG: hypothetical protein KIT09_21075 [Bryobacteraceae bacterium]|nr:hypothetical protein [Bryobacteraceae bacterium]
MLRKGLLPLIAAAIGAAHAAPSSFTLLDHAGRAPSPRVDGAIVYEDQDRRLYLFGGRDTAPRNDLWAYSIDERRWTEIETSSRPPARFGHTLVLDAVRRRLIVFGGQAGGFFSDVWAFDISRGDWQRLSPDEAGPSRRYGHSAIYDAARDRMVISHGFTDAGRFDDTWAFAFSSNRWTDISPEAGRPLRRCLHHAVYHRAGDEMILYGGCASGFGSCPLGDLWSFNLQSNRWTQASGSAPPPRQWYGAAFDEQRGRFVVVGGSGPGLLGDTWEFDPISRTWGEAALDGPAPSPRERLQGTHAAALAGTVFFGGRTAEGLSNELWLLAPPVGRPLIAAGGVVNAFSADGQAVAPGEIVTVFGSGLGPAERTATSFDSRTGRLPETAGGVSATWNGVPAPLYFVSAGQINMQAPYELGGAQQAELVITYRGAASDAVSVAVRPSHPGLFPYAFHGNGSRNEPANPAAAGSVVILFATGQGATRPASITGAHPVDGVYPEPAAPLELRIGGARAQVLFAGQAPFTAGVMQINAIVPADAEGDAVPVSLRVGDEESAPGATIAVRARQ